MEKVREEMRRVRESWKRDKGYVDFNDILVKFYETVLEHGPQVGYDVVFVDEAQDLSPLTLDIILKGVEADEVYLIGDPLQNIYESLLGTSMELFMEVANNEILLSRGHRVPQNIFRFALNYSGAPPKLFKLYSKVEHVAREGKIIDMGVLSTHKLAEIVRKLSTDGTNVSILMPTNREAVMVAKDLIRFGIIPVAYKSLSPVKSLVEIVDSVVALQQGGKVNVEKLSEALQRAGATIPDDKLKLLESPLYDNSTKLAIIFNIIKHLGFRTEYLNPDTIVNVVVDTIHASKGRENRVIVAPHLASYLKKYRGVAHRLFFVSATRTTHHLILIKEIKEVGR